MTTPAPIVFVLGGTGGWPERVHDAVRAALGDLVTVELTSDHGAVIRRALAGHQPVPVVVAGLDGAPVGLGPDEFISLRQRLEPAGTRLIAITGSASLAKLEPILRGDAVDAILTEPWTSTGFTKVLRAQVATFLVGHAPELLEAFDQVVSADDQRRAELRLERRRSAPRHEVDRAHPLLDTSSEDADLEAQLVDAIDRALGHPPRIRVAPGTVLIEIDADVGGIYVVLDGVVRLTSRTPTGEQILHEQSTGSIIGLLSLASKRQAMLQCVAVTEVRAIPVTLEQLAHALDVDVELSGLLNRVLIGSLARRLRRSDELQVELDQSLSALSEARAELVAQARMATLGDLSAGLAHELNNPTAALVRAIDHVVDDVTSHGLIADDAVGIVRHRFAVDPASTADVRARRRAFANVVGDRRLADRLADLGVDDEATAREWAALPHDQLTRRETAARLGIQLHHAASAARRVQALVDSLRAYVRGEDGAGTWVPDVDVERTIERAVQLLQHRVEHTTVDVVVAEVPTVPGRPGALQVVWGNLVANALDAVAGIDDARVTVDVSQPDDAHVRVRVSDNGRGIEPALAERIFEPRFTTKGGRVSFGLGLGLSICRQLVAEHGGTIGVESRPGRTVFSVLLPVEAPDE